MKLENVIEPKQVSGLTKRFIASLIIFLYLTPSLLASEFHFDVCHWGIDQLLTLSKHLRNIEVEMEQIDFITAIKKICSVICHCHPFAQPIAV